MYRTNERTIFEKDFYYPKKKYPYPTSKIREYEYYYFLLPKNGTRIYGRTIDDLYDKLVEENAVFLSYFTNDITLQVAIHVGNLYGHYQSNLKKDRFNRAIDTIDDVLNQSEKNPLSKPFRETKAEDLQSVIDEFSKNFNERTAREFYEEILIFVECLNFLGVKVSAKKIEFRIIKKRPKKDEHIYITQKELKLFDNEVVSHGTRYKYNDVSYIIIMVLHTGIPSKQAFYLKWGDIHFEEKQIVSEGKIYQMDNFIFTALYHFKESKDESVTKDEMPIFPISEQEEYTYAYVLNTYQVVLRNCLITQNLSLRDLQLIKGKQLLDQGMSDEEVCELLGIARKRNRWQRMQNFRIIYDNESVVDHAASAEGVNILIQSAKTLSESQRESVMRYIELIKKME